ncbi:hypothetical protein F4778DRAFT_192634 [Xylariomycetidae sp. FL2044]|nr:hypothetical protein F4778DRAFT_192634 [Xylariomycetidae sp. FL2044]
MADLFLRSRVTLPWSWLAPDESGQLLWLATHIKQPRGAHLDLLPQLTLIHHNIVVPFCNSRRLSFIFFLVQFDTPSSGIPRWYPHTDSKTSSHCARVYSRSINQPTSFGRLVEFLVFSSNLPHCSRYTTAQINHIHSPRSYKEIDQSSFTDLLCFANTFPFTTSRTRLSIKPTAAWPPFAHKYLSISWNLIYLDRRRGTYTGTQ